jgi:hypothetical protein
LFSFIASDGNLFSEADQTKQFIAYVVDSALRFARVVADDEDVVKEAAPAKQLQLMRSVYDRFNASITAAPFLDNVDDDFVKKHAGNHAAEAAEMLRQSERYEKIKDALTAEEIVSLASLSVFKKHWTTMRTTGMVFAGYGAAEYFPSLTHYICYGIVFGRLIHEHLKDEDKSINIDNTSEIVPFAQSDMMKTFMFGASPKALEEIDEYFQAGLKHYTTANRSLLVPGAQTEQLQETVTLVARNLISTYLADSHNRPLKQVIGMFSIPELANLAETLVSIESLKERVTAPSESISGPIDVVAISKSDGFVWIKRKHYFDPELNPRFMARIAR